MVSSDTLFPSRVFGTRVPNIDEVGHLTKVISWRPNVLSYVYLTKEHQILFGKEIRNEALLPYEIFLETVFRKERVLLADSAETLLLAATSDFMLIPHLLLKDRRLLELSRTLVHEQIYEEELIHTPIAGTEVGALFVIPDEIRFIWDKYLGDYQVHHLISTHFHMFERLSKSLTNFLLVHIFDGYIITTACKNQQICLSNAYVYRAHNDIFYFLLSIRSVLDLPWQLPILVLGDLEKEDALLIKIRERLPHTQVYEGWGASIASFLAETSTWRYGFMAFARKG